MMKRIFYIALTASLLCTYNGFAQNRKIFTYHDYARKYLHEEYLINTKSGRINGTYKEYDMFGKLLTEGTYINGIRVGTWNTYFNDYSFSKTGGNSYIVKTETFNNNGVLHGKYLNIYVGLNTATKGQYKNGNKYGIWEEYENSQLLSKVLFKDNIKVKSIYPTEKQIAEREAAYIASEIERKRDISRKDSIDNEIEKAQYEKRRLEQDSIRKIKEAERLFNVKTEKENKQKLALLRDIRTSIYQNFRLQCKNNDRYFNEREFLEKVEYYNDKKYVDKLNLHKHQNISNAIILIFNVAYFENDNFSSLDKKLEMFTSINEIIRGYSNYDNKKQLNTELESVDSIETIITIFQKFSKQ
jgi:antitoxin component YwqK of YwqJK toxin-antitoxin module